MKRFFLWLAIIVFVATAPLSTARAERILNVPIDYPTIQAAINAATPGSTVLVAPGEYIESIILKPRVKVESTDGPAVTTIRGVGGAVTYTVTGASDATISGFTITGSAYGNGLYNPATMTIINNIITGNRIGIYNEYSSPKIADNIITGGDQGIHNWFSSSTITNNIITGSEHGIVNWYSSPTILNNTLTSNGQSGIYIWAASSPTITNNIITSTRECGITMGGSDCYPMITYNNIWDNAADLCNLYGANPTVADNISADPMFIYPTADDYQLQEGSPCIDAGTNDAPGLPVTDADGNPRVVDGNGDGTAIVDMGAYEFQLIIP